MAKETIVVYYQPMGSIPGLTFYHTLVVYTDSDGNKWAARGGPEGNGSDSPYGNLRTNVGPYIKGHVDWSEDGVIDKSTTISSGDDLSDTWKKSRMGSMQ
jgi:hypothetical protein